MHPYMDTELQKSKNTQDYMITVGMSSDAICFCVLDSHCWKWSRLPKNFCNSLASPSLSSRTFNCNTKLSKRVLIHATVKAKIL